MPHQTPTLLTSLGFCQRYKVLNAPPSSYKINSTRIKLIAACLREKVDEQRQGKRVWVPCLDEFLADVGSEASVAVSPHLGEVGSEPPPEVAATTTFEKEEDEKEEDPDTYFKREPTSPPLGASS